MSEDLQPFVDDLLVEQKKLDAHDKLVGAEIVAQQNLKTLDEAKQFAAAWIGTASQGLRNTEYMTGERDKLLALTLAVTSDLPDSAMTTEQIDFREKVKTTVFAQLGSPEVLRVQWAESEARFAKEKREHDETRGYRQYAEKQLVDLRLELAALLVDIDDAMRDVDPEVSWQNHGTRDKLVKLAGGK